MARPRTFVLATLFLAFLMRCGGDGQGLTGASTGTVPVTFTVSQIQGYQNSTFQLSLGARTITQYGLHTVELAPGPQTATGRVGGYSEMFVVFASGIDSASLRSNGGPGEPPGGARGCIVFYDNGNFPGSSVSQPFSFSFTVRAGPCL